MALEITDKDYYTEDGKIIFTAVYHLKRGYCCGNKCRHCPFTKPAVKGTTTLENDRPNTQGPEAGGPTTVLPS